MKDVTKCVNNPVCHVWLNMCFETFADVFFLLKDDLWDHFKHNAMKTRGKIDSNEKSKQQLYVFLEKITFFRKVMFYSSLKSCNEWVSAYSRVFWINLSFLVMLDCLQSAFSLYKFRPVLISSSARLQTTMLLFRDWDALVSCPAASPLACLGFVQ